MAAMRPPSMDEPSAGLGNLDLRGWRGIPDVGVERDIPWVGVGREIPDVGVGRGGLIVVTRGCAAAGSTGFWAVSSPKGRRVGRCTIG